MGTKSTYEVYTDITKELLDSILVGDLIKVNDWKKPLRVKSVSKDYFVMSAKQFGKTVYSVCEKKTWNGVKHNEMCGGMFHVGTDGWIFGSPVFLGGYDLNNQELAQKYVESFELPEHNQDHSFISPRTSLPIRTIYIKRAKL